MGPSTRREKSRCLVYRRAIAVRRVDDFYTAAIEAGAKDNRAPGPRPHCHPNCGEAFVIDPEGNNVEAVCHVPPSVGVPIRVSDLAYKLTYTCQ